MTSHDTTSQHFCGSAICSSEGRDRPTISGRRYQYGLALIIIVQTMFCVALAFWRIPPTADQREELALVMIVVCITIALIGSAAAGTVVIASNLDRARRLWRPIGKLLTIALTAILALMLLSAALRN